MIRGPQDSGRHDETHAYLRYIVQALLCVALVMGVVFFLISCASAQQVKKVDCHKISHALYICEGGQLVDLTSIYARPDPPPPSDRDRDWRYFQPMGKSKEPPPTRNSR